MQALFLHWLCARPVQMECIGCGRARRVGTVQMLPSRRVMRGFADLPCRQDLQGKEHAWWVGGNVIITAASAGRLQKKHGLTRITSVAKWRSAQASSASAFSCHCYFCLNLHTRQMTTRFCTGYGISCVRTRVRSRFGRDCCFGNPGRALYCFWLFFTFRVSSRGLTGYFFCNEAQNRPRVVKILQLIGKM